ncbi:MAG: TonB family protein [Acidobacteria bacterium]|nr:TonB family protein [Acidobacteriota bacterium]
MRRASLVVSLLVHTTVVALWLERPAIFVEPSSVAWGFHGSSENLVYLPTSSKPEKISEKLKLSRKNRQKHAPQPVRTPSESTRAGAENGSFLLGAASGRQAMPALPIVFPDPDIHPSQLNGREGDVIVEVTIDENGNVTSTRVLQSLDNSIDEKVIATLKNWRFKPASIDGIAISSRQDVHFHFPG